MKYTISTIILFALFSANLHAQAQTVSKSKFVIGLSAPELLHAGITRRISNSSRVGVNVGLAPSWGETWISISAEHRLYFGENSVKTDQKTWFCRQGVTFFPAAGSSENFTLNLTVGKDLIFKKINNGLTIDAGIFYLPGSESSSIILIRSLNLWPALRFEFYF